MIIDEKGRIFGKINVVDFLVILFLLSLTPMFYLGYKIMKVPKLEVVPAPLSEKEFKKFIEIEIPCNLIKLKPEILKLIAVGDKEIDNEGNRIGQAVWIEKKERHEIEDPTLKQLYIKLKLKIEIKDDNLYYNNQNITNNLPFNFKTKKYIVKAISLI